MIYLYLKRQTNYWESKMKYSKILNALFVSLCSSVTSYGALSWTGTGADLDTGDVVTGTVTDTVSGGSTGYRLTVNSVTGATTDVGINWGSDGATTTGTDSRSTDGGLHWTNTDAGTTTAFTITLAFDTAVDLIWSQASDDGGGENNPFGTTYGLSGYTGTAAVDVGTLEGGVGQIVSVNNIAGSVDFTFRDNLVTGGNNGIQNSIADWTIETPTSNTYTITYSTTNPGTNSSIDNEWFAITDGFIPVPEPSSTALLGLGGLALLLRRKKR